MPESVVAKVIQSMHPDLIDAGKTIKMDFLWGVRVKVMMHRD